LEGLGRPWKALEGRETGDQDQLYTRLRPETSIVGLGAETMFRDPCHTVLHWLKVAEHFLNNLCALLSMETLVLRTPEAV